MLWRLLYSMMNHYIGWEPLTPQIYGELHKYIWFYNSLGVGQNKISWLGLEISEKNKSKHAPYVYLIDHWRVDLPVIHPQLMHAYMGTEAGFVFDKSCIWIPISFEGLYRHDGILPI